MKTKLTEDIENITTWGDERTPLASEYGTIPYGEWCEKEVARMRRNGGKAEVMRQDGQICVIRPKPVS